MTHPTSTPAGRRFASASAVLALVGASLLGGAVVAAHAAPEPEFANAAYTAVVGEALLLSGPATDGDTVTVMVVEAALPIADECSGMLVQGGSWSCIVPAVGLAVGAHELSVEAPGGSYATTNTVFLKVKDPVPAPVVFDAAGQPAEAGETLYANALDFTLSGTGVAGSLIVAHINDDDNYNATVDSGGGWADPISVYEAGSYTLDVYQNDNDGTLSPTLSYPLVVDTSALATPVISQPANGSTLGYAGETNPVTVAVGNGRPGARASVFLDGSTTPDCTAIMTTPAWSCEVATAPGAHSVAVSYSFDDTPGTTTTATSSFVIAVGAPTIGGGDPIVGPHDTQFAVTGTAQTGTIALTATATDTDPVPLCTEAVVAGGAWSCAVAAGALGVGEWMLSATQTVGGTTSVAATRALTVMGASFDSDDYPAALGDTVRLSGTKSPGSPFHVLATGVESSWGECVPADALESATWTCDLSTAGAPADLGYSTVVAGSYDPESDDPFVEGAALGYSYIDFLDPVSLNRGSESGEIVAYSNPVSITGSGIPSEDGVTNTITVTVTPQAGDPVTCVTTTGEGVDYGEGGYSAPFVCTLPGTYSDGTYSVSVIQQPSWASTASAPATAELVVDLTAPGRSILECAFTPGAVTVTSDDPSARVGLYGVDPGGDYFPSNLGLCSGRVGSPSPGVFDDSRNPVTCGGEGGEGDFAGPAVIECPMPGLAPGLWNLYYSGSEGPSWDWFFRIPEAPAFTSAGASASNPAIASFSGTGTPGNTVTVSPYSLNGGEPACAAVVHADGTWSCDALVGKATLPYRAYETDAASGGISAFTAATAPVATLVPAPGMFGGTSRTVPVGGTVTLAGSKSPGGAVTVTILDTAGEPHATFTACERTLDDDPASWQCDYSIAGLDLPPGTYDLSVTQTLQGETSAELAPRPRLTITALPAVVVPTATPEPAGTPSAEPTPTATATAAAKVPLTWTLTVTGVDGPLRPGQSVGLSSSGIPAGSIVEAELHSTPVFLGKTAVRADGTFSFTVRIPQKVEPGEHTIVVTVTAPGEDPSPLENPVQIVLDPEVAETKIFAGDLDHERFASSERAATDGNPRNDVNAPTSLTGSVPTVLEVLTSPGSIAIAAGLALVILLLVALPTEILNATIESNTSRFGRGFAAIQAAVDRGTQWFIRVTRTPLIASALLLVLTAVIFGFVDPGFGFDLASVRLVLSLAVALFVITVVATSLTGLVVKRRWTLDSAIGMQPAALLLAVVGVLVARLLEFSPGFLVGLVIGLELAHRATDRQRVRAVVIEFSFIVGFGVLAWLIYSAWAGLQGDAPLGFWGGLVQDALVAVTSEGLTGVMVAMIPVAFTDGKKIFDDSKRLWAVMFLVIGTAFALLVLPTALAGQEIGNIAVWVAVLVGFAVVVFGVTFWLRRTGGSASAEAPVRENAHH